MTRPLIPSLSAPRRRRSLSAEEHELWQAVAKSAKPLRKPRVRKEAKELLPAPEVVAPIAAKPSRSAAKPAKVAPKPSIATAAPPLVALGRRERSQLARGRKQIDARIDLHGMTQARAHGALLRFLLRAHGDGCSFVLVITGKGRTGGAESERGVLRRQVPLWLGLPEFRVMVVGFEEAHLGHGGEGALYVRLRRAR
jgi:DNA-nicking Smr family endonuclease